MSDWRITYTTRYENNFEIHEDEVFVLNSLKVLKGTS